MLRTVMSSVMRRRRGLISAIWKLLSEGSDRHPHPLRQETCHATKPLTPRQRLRSILAAYPTQRELPLSNQTRFNDTVRQIKSKLLHDMKTMLLVQTLRLRHGEPDLCPGDPRALQPGLTATFTIKG